MNKTNFYKELYSASKGNILNEFFLLRNEVFTKLLQKYKIDKEDVKECILKSTTHNVYLSMEKLLEEVPEEASYQLLVETKKRVLKRLPTFIGRLVGHIPIDVTERSPYWSEEGIVINVGIIDPEELVELERYLGKVYWSLYSDLTDYADDEGCSLLETMSSLACRDKTITTIDQEAAGVIDRLASMAKFTRIQSLIKTDKDESNIMIELMKLNAACKR